jgi:hypothetical protein
MDTYRNTAAIYVRRSAADERDTDDSDRRGCGLPRVSVIFTAPPGGDRLER